MIVTPVTYKKRSDISHVIHYILSDKGRIQELETRDSFLITHNILAKDIVGFIDEFETNLNFKAKRKNGITLIHEVISFHPDSQPSLYALEDLTRKYIELRADNALVLAKPHLHEQHLHVHLLISPNLYRSSASLRMSKADYMAIKQELEKYQKKYYPELNQSLVYLKKREKEKGHFQEIDQQKRQNKVREMKKRIGQEQKLDKEELASILQLILKNSKSAEDFLALLKKESLELYRYRDKISGIKYRGRKYRFKTLGIQKEELLKLLRQKRKQISKTQQIDKRVRPLKRAQQTIGQFKAIGKKLSLFFSYEELNISGIELYKERLKQIEALPTEKFLKKKLKFLVIRILDDSRSMKQFLYHLRQTNIWPVFDKTKHKLLGVKLHETMYTFAELGVKKQVKNKAIEFAKRQERIKVWKQKKELERKWRVREIQLYTLGFSALFGPER